MAWFFKENKTYKREIAFVILIFMGFIIWKSADADAVETLKITIWPAMLYVGTAFGMQWASKQTNLVK